MPIIMVRRSQLPQSIALYEGRSGVVDHGQILGWLMPISDAPDLEISIVRSLPIMQFATRFYRDRLWESLAPGTGIQLTRRHQKSRLFIAPLIPFEAPENV